jgi:hypothetical protein
LKVVLKYCGSCNPGIDLGAVGARLRDLLGDAATFHAPGEPDADVVVILNGCATACADRHDVRALARTAIVVAGESVDLAPSPSARSPNGWPT